MLERSCRFRACVCEWCVSVTTRRAVGLSVLHFSVVRVRNTTSRFVTCMRACVQRHRWARRTVVSAERGRRLAGAASRVMRDPWNRTATAANRSYQSPPWYANQTIPLHHRTTWTRHADDVVNVPHSFAKGPLLVKSASACVRACVRAYARCTRRRTVTGMTRLLLLLLYNIFIVYHIQYNDDETPPECARIHRVRCAIVVRQ